LNVKVQLILITRSKYYVHQDVLFY